MANGTAKILNRNLFLKGGGYLDAEGGIKVNGTTVIDSNGKIIESAGIEIANGDTFNDTNGNEVLGFGVVSSAVNYLKISNAATGDPSTISAEGSDSQQLLYLEASGQTDTQYGVVAQNIDNGSNGAAFMLYHDSASPAGNDSVARIIAAGNDDGGALSPYSLMETRIQSTTAGSETGAMRFAPLVAGVPTEFLVLNQGANNVVYIGRAIQVAKDDVTAGTGGEIPLTDPTTTINTDAGGDAFTLADGVDGQRKTIIMVVDGGGDAVITPSTFANGSTITMGDAGDAIVLEFDSTIGWVIVGGQGYAIA